MVHVVFIVNVISLCLRQGLLLYFKLQANQRTLFSVCLTRLKVTGSAALDSSWPHLLRKPDQHRTNRRGAVAKLDVVVVPTGPAL